MADQNMSWSDAWKQAEREGHSTWDGSPAPRYPKWPVVMFALSLGVFITLLPFAAALALVMAGYGASEMDDPLTIVVFGGLYASWFGIPVFLIAIALKSARTERAAAAAWIGAIVWFALTGWMYFGSS